MYSPYLFARQYELLALRELLKTENEAALDKLLPIVEPVKTSPGDLHRCMNEFAKKGRPLVVLMNPSKHEFGKTPGSQKKLRDSSAPVFAKSQCLVPGFLVTSTTSIPQVEKFVDRYAGRDVAIIFDSPSLSNQELKQLASSPSVRHQITVQQSLPNAQVSLIPAKRLIDTRDHFNRLDRNSDYGGQEFFTDRHKVGNPSIGDYATLGRRLEIGGGKPGAVVIHASYVNPKTGDVWVEHFVSDQIDRDEGTPEGKFLDAAKKLVRAVKKRPSEFGSDWALDKYATHVAQNTFPGLGKNKQYQLMHHIHLMLANT